MITLLRTGLYKLIETKHRIKILYLDRDIYAWIQVPNIGEILIATHRAHQADKVIGLGRYRLYEVVDEPKLSDHTHLELEIGGRYWQGYILLNGLPDHDNLRRRIIPSREIITNNFKNITKSRNFARV